MHTETYTYRDVYSERGRIKKQVGLWFCCWSCNWEVPILWILNFLAVLVASASTIILVLAVVVVTRILIHQQPCLCLPLVLEVLIQCLSRPVFPLNYSPIQFPSLSLHHIWQQREPDSWIFQSTLLFFFFWFLGSSNQYWSLDSWAKYQY